MTTLKDIAIKCGVSIKTVSNVINDYPHIRKEIREKVWKAVSESGYTPDERARRLVRQRENSKESPKSTSLQIGCILRPDISRYGNPFFIEVFKAIEDEIQKTGNILSFIQSTEALSKDILLYNHFLDKSRIDGIISFAYRGEVYEKMLNSFPIVTIGSNKNGLDYIEVDHQSSTYTVMNYLHKLGHRKIGLIGVPLDLQPDIYRPQYNFYMEFMKKHELSVNPNWIINSCGFFREHGRNAMQKIIEMQERPSAIFCMCDELAYGAILACRASCIKVPEEISIMAIDNLPTSELIYPGLSTVNVDKDSIGRTAVKFILTRIANSSAPQQIKIIGTSLVERESCASPTI